MTNVQASACIGADESPMFNKSGTKKSDRRENLSDFLVLWKKIDPSKDHDSDDDGALPAFHSRYSS